METTSDSQKLASYIQHIRDVHPLNTYSTQSINLVKTIYDQGMSATQMDAQIVGEVFSSSVVRGSYFDSIDPEIRTIIESSNTYSVRAILKVGIRTYNMFFVFPMAQNNISISVRNKCLKYVNAFIKRAHIWLNIASHYACPKCSTVVNVYLYLISHKKETPKMALQPVDKVHINTAFTTPCMEHTEIVLFRREEAFKVFIHESFHNLGLDFSAFENVNKRAEQIVRSVFHINASEMPIYECYTEMWAEIINIIVADIVAHPRRRGFETAWLAIVRQINMERRFTMFQVAKLLYHNNMTYDDLLRPGNKYCEKSSAFCYFVLKSLLLFRCDAFLDWCAKHNIDRGEQSCGGGRLQFNPAKAETFVNELIITQYRNPEYVEALHKTHAYFVKSKSKMPVLLRNTMRMTITE